MSQPLFPAINLVSGVSGSTKVWSCNGGALGSGTDTNISTPVAAAGVIDNLKVRVSVAPGTGNTITYTLIKAGVDTAQTCSISGDALTCSDSANPITFAASDTCSIRSQATAGTPATSNSYVSAAFTGTTDGEALIMGATTSGMPTGATNYMTIYGTTVATTTVAAATTTMPTAGVVDKMYIAMSGTPGAGKSYALTLYKNGLATALTCTVSDAATTCNEPTATVTFAAGDSIAMESVPTGTPTARTLKWGFRFLPTTNGESPLFVRDLAPQNSTRYSVIIGNSTNIGTESSNQASTSVAFTLKNLYFAHGYYGAPTGAQTRTLTARKNTADTGLTATISSAVSFASDLVNTVDYAVDDLVNFKFTVSGTPPTSALLVYSATAYIAPAAGGATSVTPFNLNGIFNLNGWANIRN